ncbi:flagellar biosynthesis anti-sigma factor FlgM [Halomonas ventosae]|uniref:flagellar biosynthesis anti-sigma factor FlgM n=1 Tax=Halomonas ventosae TaxID=229007 RepID=UPI001FB788BF|nr:flagellar biosynthesis anti-sigma factor FlgM [Halomonas ventosae]
MKIDNTQPPQRPVEGAKPAKPSAQQPQPTGSSTPSAVAHLGAASGASAGQDVDQARVDEIRQAISEGKLEVRADRIAEGLLASVQDILSRKD